MAFKSAELKMAYEALHQTGVALSAAEAGRLFRSGALSDLVAAFIDYAADLARMRQDLKLLEFEIARKEATVLGRTFVEGQLLGERVYIRQQIDEATAIIELYEADARKLDALYAYRVYLMETLVWIDQRMRELMHDPTSWAILKKMRTQYEGWVEDNLAAIAPTEAAQEALTRAVRARVNWYAELNIVEGKLWNLGADAQRTVRQLDELYDDHQHLLDIIAATEAATQRAADRWTL